MYPMMDFLALPLSESASLDNHPAHSGTVLFTFNNPRQIDQKVSVKSGVWIWEVDDEAVRFGSNLFLEKQGGRTGSVNLTLRCLVLGTTFSVSMRSSQSSHISWIKMPCVECVVPAPDGVSSLISKLSQQRWLNLLQDGEMLEGKMLLCVLTC